ncbi:hypothetical protein [Edaphobacter bradus]|uniref:hypothetical protein n=1 Tax=Edaphobacter bradus TaxID=2259016 RepID=UPI0021DF9570|nr:hypothetical protein [Edaphobacter bradus]
MPISPPTLARMTGFPGRWFVYSMMLHCTLLGVVALLRATPALAPADPEEAHLVQRLDNITPLPELVKAGAEGQSGPQHRAPEKTNSSADSHNGTKTYYGVQHIVSAPTTPDNSTQTVLQPDLLSPPKLPRPVPLPNMVKLAMPRSLVLPNLPQVKVTRAAPPIPTAASIQNGTPIDLTQPDQTALISKSPVPPLPTREHPRLPVPVSSTPALEAVIARVQQPAAPAPTSRHVEPTASTAAPASSQTAHPQSGTDDRNLLVINAVSPADATAHGDPPPGELHGAFEVVPSLLPQGSSSAPGSSSSSSQTPGNTGRASATNVAGGGTGAGKSGGDDKSSSGGGHSNSSDGHGAAAAAITAGAGSGVKGPASGAGGSTGSQSGPFANVTVVARNKITDATPPPSPAPPAKQIPHSEGYGMTIISSGSSGGGLRDYGVFRDGGPTYTIYLDVTNIGIHSSRWSLQYGVSQEIRKAHLGVPLAPPYAVKEALPLFPASIVAANVGRMMVVQAELSAEGKLEAFHVLQSPDPKLSVLLEECLMHWAFQAASFGEEPVPIKVLLGIPIAAVMASSAP